VGWLTVYTLDSNPSTTKKKKKKKKEKNLDIQLHEGNFLSVFKGVALRKKQKQSKNRKK
jgi:hypothetical protein